MTVSSTTLANDAGKYLVDKLLERSELLMVMTQMAEKVSLPQGMAKTAEFIRYERMEMPMEALTEGSTPTNPLDFTISKQSIVVDQWGFYITLTDVAILTTKHPVLNEATQLMADSLARVHDFIVTDALMAGTNIQYLDGTVASRAALVATDVFKASVFNKARATLNDDGAPPREGNVFVAVCGPQVEADIVQESANNSFASFNSYAGKIDKLEKGVVGTWLGFRVVRTNFIPKFNRVGSKDAAVADGDWIDGGTGIMKVDVISGSLGSATFYYVIVRKSIQRGFSEDISVQHSTATGAGSKGFRFTAETLAGYVYDIYFGSVSGTLYLVKANLASGQTYDQTTSPSSGNSPPLLPSVAATAPTVHPIFCFAKAAVDHVELAGSSMAATVTPATPSDTDPLVQRRKIGTKFMAKAGIRTSERLLRIELCSNF